MNNKKLQYLINKIINQEFDSLLENHTLIQEGDDVIYKAFIEPFKDIVDTAVHSTKTIAAQTGSDLLKTIKMGVMTLLPFVGPKELDNIEKQADAQLQKYLNGLDDQYKDVLQRNIESMQTRDAKYFSFFLRPDLFFAKQIATGAPLAALELLDTLSLGNEKVRALKNKVENIHKTVNPPGASGGPFSGGGGMSGGGYVDYDIGDGGLEETLQGKQKIAVKKEIEALLDDPEIVNAMKNNPIIQGIAKTQAQAVIDRAGALSKANTFEDVKKFMGTDASKMEAELTKNFPKEATPEEVKQLLDGVVPEIKNMYKSIYKNYLTNFLKLDNLYPKDIQKAIQKIDQLS